MNKNRKKLELIPGTVVQYNTLPKDITEGYPERENKLGLIQPNKNSNLIFVCFSDGITLPCYVKELTPIRKATVWDRIRYWNPEGAI